MDKDNILTIEEQTIDALLVGGTWYEVNQPRHDTPPRVIVTPGVEFVTYPEDEEGEPQRILSRGICLTFWAKDVFAGDSVEMTVPLRAVDAIRYRRL